MVESHEQARMRKNHNIALYSNIEGFHESLNVDPNETSNSMDNPMTLVSQVGDTMHLHQTMKQPD